MSNELTKQPKELESTLAVTMRGIGERIVQGPVILGALTAAERLKAGLVISGDAEAAEVADLVAQVIAGQRWLNAQVQDAMQVPRKMEAAIRGATMATSAQLELARQAGNRARLDYQNTQRRRAAEEMERQRKEVEEAARIAAEAGGEDIPPPAEVAEVEVPRTVSGGTGKMGTQVRIVAEEVVEWGEVPREWLQLDATAARNAFNAMGWKKPAPGESVVRMGVRFTAVESVVNRRCQ